MPLIFDTSILVDYLREYEPAIHYLQLVILKEKANISVISAMELVQGAADKRSFHIAQRFLSRFFIIHLSDLISEEAFNIQQKYHFPYRLKLADALIAATALEHNSTLITQNIKDFQYLPRLKVKKPY